MNYFDVKQPIGDSSAFQEPSHSASLISSFQQNSRESYMNRDLYKEIERDREITNSNHLKNKTPQKYSDIMRRQQSNQKSPQKRSH